MDHTSGISGASLPSANPKSDSAVSQAASRWIQQGRRASLSPTARQMKSPAIIWICMDASSPWTPFRNLSDRASWRRRPAAKTFPAHHSPVGQGGEDKRSGGPSASPPRDGAVAMNRGGATVLPVSPGGEKHSPRDAAALHRRHHARIPRTRYFRRCSAAPQSARHQAADREQGETEKAEFPSGQWDVPRPNHTWVFDSALGDIVVWDGDPDHEPYRPWLTLSSMNVPRAVCGPSTPRRCPA